MPSLQNLFLNLPECLNISRYLTVFETRRFLHLGVLNFMFWKMGLKIPVKKNIHED